MATITVTNTNDSGSGSLRDAIAFSSSSDTIYFASNLANQTITLSSQLSIGVDKKLTIDAYGASNLTISGNNSTRVFSIGDYAEVTLNNLTIANGKVQGDGGGGIKAGNFVKVNINNSTFNNNTSSDGGGIQTGGYSQVSVLNSNFNGNNAQTGVGGGIQVQSYSNLSVSNSYFKDNASSAGGGIETGYNSTATVINSGFESNSGINRPTGYGAGAIASQTDGSLTIKDSRFYKNLGDQGGAVYKGLGGLVIENSYFLENSSNDGGGAVYTDGANAAGPDGTGSTKGGLIHISDSHFENNKSVGEGGAVQLYQYYPDKAIVENSTFIGNSINENGDGMALGGAIRTLGDVTIRNVAFAYNSSAQQGGAIWYDGTVNSKNSDLNVENSTFFNNNAKTYGGAITVNPNASAGVNIVNSTIDSNYAGDAGGAFWIVGGQSAKLTNSIVANNTANDGKGSAQQSVYQLTDGGGNIESPLPQSAGNFKVVANSLITDLKLGVFGSTTTTGRNIGPVVNGTNEIVSQVSDILTGSAGNDSFVYTDINQSSNVINDFELGKDKIVFTDLLTSIGYSGSDPIADGYVKVVQGASDNNFKVLIDADGSTGGNIFKSFLTVNVAGADSPNNSSNFVF